MKINVADFIDFCSQVNSRSYLDVKKKKAKRPSDDKNLYVAFVGEFNSGKSALINAILRQNLLKVDFMSGTTRTPTFIRYGKDFDIVVKYTNGQTMSFKQERPGWSSQDLYFETGPIRDCIDTYTTTERYSAWIDRVTIYLDNPVLQNGLVIVDTPSFNASARHSSTAAKQVLDIYCDTAVILTPASMSCSDTLFNFIEANLSELDNRCLAIVSKIDSLDFMEHEIKTLDYVKQRFKSKFDKLTVDVLPVSSVYSQGQNEKYIRIGSEAAEHYKTMFVNFEKSLLSLCESVKSQCCLDNQSALSQERLDELKQKSEDKNLYLGIVGEFSSGKSTLINAILHQNLLKEDILQGTTCAPTFIQYGKDFDIVVKYASDKTFSFRQEHPDSASETINFENGLIRDFIDKYTATEEYSAQLDRVTVYINNPALQNNLVIVDTPGINADNKRHSTVTKQTLERDCDAALILTPANAVCSIPLCTFVTENLSGLENRCIGIVSQIDKVRRPAEQDNLVETVSQKFKTELGKPLAAVLPVSAIYSQGENKNENPIRPDLAKRYKDMFSDFEKTIHERLIKGRERILALNMQESVMETIDLLQNILDKRKKTLHTREENLKNNQLSDIESFKNNLVQNYSATFKDIDEQINIDALISPLCDSAIDNIKQELFQCQSVSGIKNYVKNELKDRCKQAAESVGEKIKSTLNKYSKWGEKSCNDFQTKFSTEFRNLAQGVQFSLPDINSLPTDSPNIGHIDVSFDDDEFERFVVAGIVTGILAFITGPFAWIIWPFLMRIFGGSLDDKKTEVWNKMKPDLEKCFEDMKQKSKASFIQTKYRTQNAVFDQINGIVDQFKPTVNSIISNEKAELEQLQSQQEVISSDLNQLHQFELESTDF